MKHCVFGNTSKKFKVAILIKESSFSQHLIQKHYVDYLVSKGIPAEDIIALSLDYTANNKAPMSLVVPCLDNLLKAAKHIGVKTLYVADATYFKKLANVRKVEPYLGMALPCKMAGYEGMQVIGGINYQAMMHDSVNSERLLTSLHTLKCHLGGKLVRLGSDIIHSSTYPENTLEISKFLESIKQHPTLYADIEAFSLKHWEAGIATIGFSWDEHNGGAFCVDAYASEDDEDFPTQRRENKYVRELLRQFFDSYTGKIIWHNGSYDIKVLVYNLYMENDIDYDGMVTGLNAMCRDVGDSKIIAYLALNSCGAKNSRYGLKSLAQEFAGNYAQDDINDVRKIPTKKLLKYNLVDCLSTAYVVKKYYPRMQADLQEDVYNTVFLPSLRVLIKTELVGMPINLDRVKEVDFQLGSMSFDIETNFRLSRHVREFEERYREALAIEYNNTHKVKRKTADDFKTFRVNINSNDVVGDLLYEHLGLPILETTDTGLPSCSGDTLKLLLNHTKDPEIIELINAIMSILEIEKIRGTFIKAFYKNTVKKQDGNTYLHGNFNLGGAVSGRLSSSNPNLTNLPSGSTYGKLIKSCFQSNDKWLFCGADYNALEARADALWTKDKNKLAVYQGGYDSHSYNTFVYWPSKFPEIVEAIADLPADAHKERAAHINTIETKHKEDRSNSKSVTFALQFKGTANTLHKRSGFPMDEAITIVSNYDTQYRESKEATDKRIAQANKDGYVTVAFGLRVRTPLIASVVFDDAKGMPYQVQAEIRTAANAMSQSYGQLTNLVMCNTIADAERENLAILPSCQIHDAVYLLCERKLSTLKKLNDSISKHMSWVPSELYHPEVGLSGELEIYYPDWSKPVGIPNYASEEEIREITTKS